MIEVQIISKILADKDVDFITQYDITADDFSLYADESKFIFDHLARYKKIPDVETFLSEFPDFDYVEVFEDDEFLVDKLYEHSLYSKSVPVINELVNLMQKDSTEAVNYLQTQLKTLKPKSRAVGVDIISTADKRLEAWQQRKLHPEKYIISTGFDEIDQKIGGWQRGEEFVVIFARTGKGKSWILIKSLMKAWRLGYRVGLIEPEMSDVRTGYRFDTLYKSFSNRALMWGHDCDDYSEYIAELKQSSTPFIFASPKDFDRNITVSKLKKFIQDNKIEILGIDGISYLRDERRKKYDSRTTELTNISEDLMDLSIELKVPIIAISQSNREGAKEDNGPSLENIRDSDGIAYNSTLVMSVNQKGPGVELAILKNRNGITGDKFVYMWDIDKGQFNYVSSDNDDQAKQLMEKYDDSADVF